jgi:hypothetical protein
LRGNPMLQTLNLKEFSRINASDPTRPKDRGLVGHEVYA